MKYDVTVTPEMIKHHEQRIASHVEAVQDILRKAKANADDSAMEEIIDKAIQNAEWHDEDKNLGGDLFIPYALIDWKYKEEKEGREFPYTKEMKAATKRHAGGNSHHPEYWDERYVNEPELFDTGKQRDATPSTAVDATSMTDEAIAEMTADWKATGMERGNTAWSWYEAAVPSRFKFSPRQRKIIEKLISLVE